MLFARVFAVCLSLSVSLINVYRTTTQKSWLFYQCPKEQVGFLAAGEDLRVVRIQKQQDLEKKKANIHTGLFFLSTVQI